ncbi:MAG: class I SAM-dependent methyltransferase [Gemmatimonadota bacterium]
MDSRQLELHASMEERHWWFLGRRRVLHDLVTAAVPSSGSTTIVDVGCGTGANIAAFDPQYRVVGIDPSPAAVDLAARRFPQVAFLCGEAEVIGAEALARADLVLLTDVLEHVADDRRFLAGLLARLKGGARLLATVPAHPELWSSHDIALGHHRRYTAETFRQLWNVRDVEFELISYFNSRLFPIARLSRVRSQKLGVSLGSRGTDLKVPWRPVNAMLARVFAGEAHRLRRVLGGGARPYRNGLSLIGLFRCGGEGEALPVDDALA